VSKSSSGSKWIASVDVIAAPTLPRYSVLDTDDDNSVDIPSEGSSMDSDSGSELSCKDRRRCYAVRLVADPGIFASYADCLKQGIGCKTTEIRKCNSRKEAKEYLQGWDGWAFVITRGPKTGLYVTDLRLGYMSPRKIFVEQLSMKIGQKFDII
jgi:hypothetical protein